MKLLKNANKTFVDIRGKEFTNPEEANAWYTIIDLLGNVTAQDGFQGNERARAVFIAGKLLEAGMVDYIEIEDQDAELIKRAIAVNRGLPAVIEQQVLACICEKLVAQDALTGEANTDSQQDEKPAE